MCALLKLYSERSEVAHVNHIHNKGEALIAYVLYYISVWTTVVAGEHPLLPAAIGLQLCALQNHEFSSLGTEHAYIWIVHTSADISSNCTCIMQQYL